jgi:hypothetical protein
VARSRAWLAATENKPHPYCRPRATAREHVKVTTRSRLALLAILPALALAGCAPGASPDGSPDGGPAASGPNCDEVTTAGYELFVDPRLEVEPQADVYPLDAGDTISFADTGTEGVYTTYSYSLSYIDDGQAFPNTGATFVGAEDTNEWTLEGPVTASGIDGGPYAGFMDIEATTETGTTVLARLCVVLAP